VDHLPADALPERAHFRPEPSPGCASSLPRAWRRTHHLDVPNLRSDGVRAATQTPTARRQTGPRPCVFPRSEPRPRKARRIPSATRAVFGITVTHTSAIDAIRWCSRRKRRPQYPPPPNPQHQEPPSTVVRSPSRSPATADASLIRQHPASATDAQRRSCCAAPLLRRLGPSRRRRYVT